MNSEPLRLFAPDTRPDASRNTSPLPDVLPDVLPQPEAQLPRPESAQPGCTAAPAAQVKYRAAVALYASTSLSCAAISRQCGVSAGGLYAHLRRYHRELILKRNGIRARRDEAAAIRLRGRRGQSPAARAKYGKAILACDSLEYIELNVSQIARLFGVNATGLAYQLRSHYPEILERRERERRRRGVNDNQQRGMRPWCREQYAGAVELLRTTDATLAEAAEACGVSFSGLREHVLSYCKDLIRRRAVLRDRSKGQKRIGSLNGTGGKHRPSPATERKYAEAVRLFRTTALTQREIAARTGVSLCGFRYHLSVWHRDAILERRGANPGADAGSVDLQGVKHYLKSTAVKYAGAIERLRTSGLSTAEVAREFGLNPEVFRMYLHEHEPALAARLGMKLLPGGRRVSARSLEKYAEAVRLYETTGEPLRAIARRLGLVYNSLSGFIRRNCPEAVARRRA